MAIRVRCLNSACEQVLNVKNEYAGKIGICPACGTLLVVPDASTASPFAGMDIELAREEGISLELSPDGEPPQGTPPEDYEVVDDGAAEDNIEIFVEEDVAAGEAVNQPTLHEVEQHQLPSAPTEEKDDRNRSAPPIPTGPLPDRAVPAQKEDGRYARKRSKRRRRAADLGEVMDWPRLEYGINFELWSVYALIAAMSVACVGSVATALASGLSPVARASAGPFGGLGLSTLTLILVVGLSLVSPGLMLTGRVLCFWALRQHGAKLPALLALCLAMVSLLFLVFGALFLDLLRPLAVLLILLGSVLWICGTIIFVLCLRVIAIFLKEPDVAANAIQVLVVTGIMGAAWILQLIIAASHGAEGTRGAESGLGLFVALACCQFILAIIWLVLYTRLLTSIRASLP